MPYDSTLPVDHSPIVAAELRNQFNALKDLLDALQLQLAPLLPVLTRDGAGNWTVAFTGPVPSTWQIWARSSAAPDWVNAGENHFPATDDDLNPGGTWWQIKIVGEDGDGAQTTPFSNIVTVGTMP